MCPKKILPYCPKSKINLDFVIYMISHWHSVKFSCLTFLKMRKHLLIIPVCVNTVPEYSVFIPNYILSHTF